MEFHPIGHVETEARSLPRHYTVSDVTGRLVLDNALVPGLVEIGPGQKIVVLFHFDRSPAFTPGHLTQTPPHKDKPMGVFSICSPVRPNPIGLSILDVTAVKGNVIEVRGLDMLDQTPILDLKPFIPPAG